MQKLTVASHGGKAFSQSNNSQKIQLQVSHSTTQTTRTTPCAFALRRQRNQGHKQLRHNCTPERAIHARSTRSHHSHLSKRLSPCQSSASPPRIRSKTSIRLTSPTDVAEVNIQQTTGQVSHQTVKSPRPSTRQENTEARQSSQEVNHQPN
jgi:hypothetical protein